MKDKIDVLEKVEKAAYDNLMSKRTLACSQAVNLAIQEIVYDGEIDKLIIKALAPFAGGSRENSLCGALVGGIMGIGIKYGVDIDKMSSLENLTDSYKPVIKFYNKFDEFNDSRYCFDIIGYNLNIKEERKEWLDNKGWESCAERCGKSARVAAEIILEH